MSLKKVSHRLSGIAELTGGRETGVHRPDPLAVLLLPLCFHRRLSAFLVGGALVSPPPS